MKSCPAILLWFLAVESDAQGLVEKPEAKVASDFLPAVEDKMTANYSRGAIDAQLCSISQVCRVEMVEKSAARNSQGGWSVLGDFRLQYDNRRFWTLRLSICGANSVGAKADEVQLSFRILSYAFASGKRRNPGD